MEKMAANSLAQLVQMASALDTRNSA
jgi:FixJ family two-component response regulator